MLFRIAPDGPDVTTSGSRRSRDKKHDPCPNIAPEDDAETPALLKFRLSIAPTQVTKEEVAHTD
ncbi:MAG: hypothetical protein L6R28_13785 [Planctomycetes bacterium]|nr:hypothetical protein [Planctomycetota bacterium]